MTTIIVTRPKSVIHQAGEVYQKAGFSVYEAPCFDIQTNAFVQPQWLNIPADVLVILSVHALHHALIISPQWQPAEKTRVIGVGPAVVKAWQQKFTHQIESHPSMNSEGVIMLLEQKKPKAVKILSTVNGREKIKLYCMQHRISYNQINTYQRLNICIDASALSELLHTKESVILTATSVGVLTHLMSQLSPRLKQELYSIPLIVGAKRIGAVAKKMGFDDVHMAANPSDSAMSNMAIELSKKTN